MRLLFLCPWSGKVSGGVGHRGWWRIGKIAAASVGGYHGVKLRIQLGLNLFLEHGGQKAQLGFQFEQLVTDMQLPFHAIASKVKHIQLFAFFVAALHAKFGAGFICPSPGVLAGDRQAQRVLAFNEDVGHR